MTSIKQQIVRHIEALEGDQVKSLVLNWLTQSQEVNLIEFERLLESQLSDERAIVYGELDETLSFQPMSEEAMAEKSLEVLEEYQHNLSSVPHDQVRDWLDSLGTDHPLPCPK
jgi:hypothetical protein